MNNKYNLINEIEIGIPASYQSDSLNIIRDRTISYMKEIIQDEYNSFLNFLLDEVDVPGGDSNYNIVASFIIEQMIANNYELYHNGEEILLTNSNSNLVTKEDIENYIEENQGLKKYLEKITWGYYFDQIDINDLYKECIKAFKNDMERGNWGEGEYQKDDLEYIVDKTLDQHNLWPDTFLTYSPEFQDYLQTQFLRADKLSEMKNNQLLREYPESTISRILTKWGLDPDPKSQDSKVKAARALITRFEQIKEGIQQKLDILVIPDDIKNKDPKNIELYSLDDMIKLIKSYPENVENIKKEAVKNFVTNEYIDKEAAQSYVSRFIARKSDLKYALANGTETLTKEEIIELIPKRLLQNELYLDPRNWKWQPFEQMMDSLFPTEAKVSGEINNVTTDADKIYDKDGIEIYKGDDKHKCISYNPKLSSGRQKYSWCVTQAGSGNMYDRYRLERGTPTFYFIFDRNRSSAPDHNPFQDVWHAFVIRIDEDSETYHITHANNPPDATVKGWDSISKVIPADIWNKIKNLKDYFKPIPLSSPELSRKFASGRNLSLDEFKELSQDDKKNYVEGKAQNNALGDDILQVLSKYNYVDEEGKNTTLANTAINNGQQFPYSILKNSEALAKRYAIVRFRQNDPIPLPYIKYLDEKGKQGYYEAFDKGGANNDPSYLTFELIEKYFGPKITQQYVEKQLKKLGYLPPAAINYIKNPKLKILFETYSKLFESWVFSNTTNQSEEELANLKKQPRQKVWARPISVKQWGKLSPAERKTIIELTEKYNGDTDYLELLFGLPFIIKDKGKNLILLPESNNDDTFLKWVLVDENDKVVKRNISGESLLDDSNLLNGFISNVQTEGKRIYDMSELEIEDAGPLNEIKDGKDLWELMKPEFEKTILGKLKEIEVGLPGRTWDFTKYIPNFNWGDIREEDIMIIPRLNYFTPYGKLKVSSVNDWDSSISFTDGSFIYVYDLEDINEGNKKSLKEIEVGIPALPFKQLVKDYTKYLNGITRAEMFDENGMYNSKLKDYHDQIKYYAQNGTEEEQQVANFALSFIS
jgi:hypothetical protein